MKPIELPRLSNALRKFGNFSANYDEIEDSRFQVCFIFKHYTDLYKSFK